MMKRRILSSEVPAVGSVIKSNTALLSTLLLLLIIFSSNSKKESNLLDLIAFRIAVNLKI